MGFLSRKTSKSVAFRNRVKWTGAHLLVVGLDFTHFVRKCLRNQALSRFSFLKYPAWTGPLGRGFLTFFYRNHPKIGYSLIPKWSSLKQPIPIYIHLLQSQSSTGTQGTFDKLRYAAAFPAIPAPYFSLHRASSEMVNIGQQG